MLVVYSATKALGIRQLGKHGEEEERSLEEAESNLRLCKASQGPHELDAMLKSRWEALALCVCPWGWLPVPQGNALPTGVQEVFAHPSCCVCRGTGRAGQQHCVVSAFLDKELYVFMGFIDKDFHIFRVFIYFNSLMHWLACVCICQKQSDVKKTSNYNGHGDSL